MIKAVFFDVDGTLVDSDGPIVYAVQAAFSEAGLRQPTTRQILKFAGYPALDWIDCVLRELQVNRDPTPLAEATVKILRHHLEKHGSQIPGASKTLTTLKKLGVKLIVVSNGSSKSLPSELKEAKLWHFFDEVIGVEQLVIPKPNSDSFVHIMSKLKLKPIECLYVGDTQIDYEYARGAHVPFALLKNHRNHSVKADYHLKKFSDLTKVVSKC